MNPNEFNLRRKIHRRTEAMKKIEIEITRYAEILAMIDIDEVEQKRVINRIRKLKQRRDIAEEEKKKFIKELINKY